MYVRYVQLNSTYLLTYTSCCTATVRGIKSTKSCLHILAERGNYELTKLLLDRLLTDPTRRSRLLEATVLTELEDQRPRHLASVHLAALHGHSQLEGQRPRHLASVHLAALHGHSQLVELFLDCGIDVNARNNKNDTPVLWAARRVDTVPVL